MYKCQECNRGIEILPGKLLMRNWGVVHPWGRGSLVRNSQPRRGLEIRICSLSGNYSWCICALKVLRVFFFIRMRRCQNQNGALKKEEPREKAVSGRHRIKRACDS